MFLRFKGALRTMLGEGLDAMVLTQVLQFQESENCPEFLRAADGAYLVQSAMALLLSESPEERKTQSDALIAYLEPFLLAGVLNYEMAHRQKVAVQLQAENDDRFWELYRDFEESPLKPQLEQQLAQWAEERGTNPETEKFLLIRRKMKQEGKPLELSCTLQLSDLETGAALHDRKLALADMLR